MLQLSSANSTVPRKSRTGQRSAGPDGGRASYLSEADFLATSLRLLPHHNDAGNGIIDVSGPGGISYRVSGSVSVKRTLPEDNIGFGGRTHPTLDK